MVEVDECVRRPKLIAQFFSSNNVPWSFKQRGQHLKWLLLQPYFLSPLAQFPRLQVHFERTEPDYAGQGIGGHGRLLFAAV
jgi:hypothetical protein